jgi:hypothetical protein
MSRLLHAAARGARIQEKTYILSIPAVKNRWATIAAYIPTADYKGDEYRIHPDDAHLQYGPISTALRDVAMTGDCGDYEIPYCRFVIEKEDIYSESTEDERSMFLLFLAEALADEGM